MKRFKNRCLNLCHRNLFPHRRSAFVMSTPKSEEANRNNIFCIYFSVFSFSRPGDNHLLPSGCSKKCITKYGNQNFYPKDSVNQRVEQNS